MGAILKRLDLKTILLSFATLASVNCDNKRPFYIIGHQVNSIEEVKEYLDKGSNVLESDIRFYSNGSVKELHHGWPCDCNRNCLHKANLRDYLRHVRDITDPKRPDSYYEKMLVQFFDMKLGDSSNKAESGRDVARHVLDYLWSEDGDRKQEVRVLLYCDQVDHSDIVIRFLNEFKDRGKEDRLSDVGYDGGFNDLAAIHETFAKIGVAKNVWLGDGNINCFNAFHPYARLEEELTNRDSDDRFIEKVYAWTIDQGSRMRRSLRLGVDGMITNVPERLLNILQEPEFKAGFRLGGVDDDPFAYYNGK